MLMKRSEPVLDISRLCYLELSRSGWIKYPAIDLTITELLDRTE